MQARLSGREGLGSSRKSPLPPVARATDSRCQAPGTVIAVAHRATLYLLTGLPGSGKTTYARWLETSGVARVSVDEMMIESNGQLGVDYDHADHLQLLEPIVAAATRRVVDHLRAGLDVVFDHGLGRRAERDAFKKIAEEHDASWQLLCFVADMTTLHDRCRERTDLPDTVPISPSVLEHLADAWERPVGEGETIITTD